MYIMDDVLDLMDSLGGTLEKGKRTAMRMLRGQSGFSTLVTVLVILALGAIVITPVLAFVVTGQRAGSTHKETTHRYYAADTGIQDGMWKVTSGDLPDWMKADWNESVYAHAVDNYTSYQLPSQINGDDVTVGIKAMWLLEGLETPSGTQQRTPNPDLVIVSNIIPGGQIQIVIICGSPTTTYLSKIGVWIPKGFSRDSSVATNLVSPYPVPVIAQSDFRNGEIITFTFGPAVRFDSLPGGTGNRRVITFNYTPAGGSMDTSWSWCVTSGDNPKLAWSDDIKLYQVESTATNPTTGQSTSVISQTMTNDSIGTYLAYYGDYAATGNAFLRDKTGDDIRETLYQNSPGAISSIPDSATPRKVMLYWSGWKHDPQDVSGYDNATLQGLAANYHVNEVSLTVQVGTTTWTVPGSVTADGWTVVADTLSGTPDGWSYSCRIDITGLVTTHFGSSFVGNATYTVGHADIEAAAPTAQTMQGIWGRSSSDVFVVGAAGSITHFDGTSWSTMTVPSGTPNLYGVWGSSTNVFAVGGSGSTTAKRLKYDGSSWTSSSSTRNQALRGVWSSTASDVWAVGDSYRTGSSGSYTYYYTIQHTTNGGTSWTEVNPATGVSSYRNLYGIWGSNATHIFAVGASGTILFGDGSSWASRSAGITSDLLSVWGTSNTNVIAVGANGRIYSSTDGTGTSWSAMTGSGTLTTSTLRGVWGTTDGTQMFAVGDGGVILHYISGSWHKETTPTVRNLSGAWGSSASDVYAVGETGTVLHYDGSTWSSVFGNYPLYGWVDGHGTETVVGSTDFRLGDNAPSSPSSDWNLCSGAWSVITIYTSPVTLAHQMYLYDTFEYCPSNGYLQYDLSGFLAPAGIASEDDAVRVTCFVSEGDQAYSPDTIWMNTQNRTSSWTRLNNGATGSATDSSNVWNGKSSTAGTAGYPADCVDIDTFSVTKGYVRGADSTASIWAGDNPTVTTGSGSGMDAWNMVYIVLSFRSDRVGSGLVTYIVK